MDQFFFSKSVLPIYFGAHWACLTITKENDQTVTSMKTYLHSKKELYTSNSFCDIKT